jgi:hypothetical protein
MATQDPSTAAAAVEAAAASVSASVSSAPDIALEQQQSSARAKHRTVSSSSSLYSTSGSTSSPMHPTQHLSSGSAAQRQDKAPSAATATAAALDAACLNASGSPDKACSSCPYITRTANISCHHCFAALFSNSSDAHAGTT